MTPSHRSERHAWQPGGYASALQIGCPEGDLQRIVRFGPSGDREPIWYLQCPRCERRAEIDPGQFNGRISVQCEPPCTFHETYDYASYVREALAGE